MKKIAIDLGCGLIFTLLIWLITFNNHFVFGIFTLFIFPILMVLFYFATSHLKWYFSTLNFILCFFIAGHLTDVFGSYFPNLEMVNDEYFALSDYYIFYSIFWILLKNIFEILLKIILPKRFYYKSEIEKLYDRIKNKFNVSL